MIIIPLFSMHLNTCGGKIGSTLKWNVFRIILNWFRDFKKTRWRCGMLKKERKYNTSLNWILPFIFAMCYSPFGFAKNFRIVYWNLSKICIHLLERSKWHQWFTQIVQECREDYKKDWNFFSIRLQSFDTLKPNLITIFKIQVQLNHN